MFMRNSFYNLHTEDVCSIAPPIESPQLILRGLFLRLLYPRLTLNSVDHRTPHLIIGTVLANAKLKRQLVKFAKQYPVHVSTRTAPLLFSANGGGFTAQTIVNLFKRIYKLAGIDGASSHSGRRQFVTQLADRGINARLVQVLARHKHLCTTQRYIDVNESKLRGAIELI
jgi:integrase